MKNEYNKKKRIAIILLSAVAVCLAGGLLWYMGTLGNPQPSVPLTENQLETEPTVTVPEIQPEATAESEPSSEPETEAESETAVRQEKESNSAAGTVTGAVKAKPSADKQKSPV